MEIAHTSLVEPLLCELFTKYSDLRRFLRKLPDCRRIEHELPNGESSASLAELIYHAATVLHRRGLLGEEFFRALLEEFPWRARQIRQQAAKLGLPALPPDAVGRPRWFRRPTRTRVTLQTAGAALVAIAAVWAIQARPVPQEPATVPTGRRPESPEQWLTRVEHWAMRMAIWAECRSIARDADALTISYSFDPRGTVTRIIPPYNSGNMRLAECAVTGSLARWKVLTSFGQSGDRSFQVVFDRETRV